MIKWRNTPFQDVIQATINLYGEINCEIVFDYLQEEEKAYGVTQFCDDGTVIIRLDVNTELCHLVETLAHELAHVVVNDVEDNHSEVWEKTFQAIKEEYDKYCEDKYQKD